MKERTIELLSPAGSFEAMQAAINAGANAIYFGNGSYSVLEFDGENWKLLASNRLPVECD